jgi:hypothetical protein
VWLLCHGKRRPDVVVRDTEPRSACAELPLGTGRGPTSGHSQTRPYSAFGVVVASTL